MPKIWARINNNCHFHANKMRRTYCYVPRCTLTCIPHVCVRVCLCARNLVCSLHALAHTSIMCEKHFHCQSFDALALFGLTTEKGSVLAKVFWPERSEADTHWQMHANLFNLLGALHRRSNKCELPNARWQMHFTWINCQQSHCVCVRQCVAFKMTNHVHAMRNNRWHLIGISPVVVWPGKRDLLGASIRCRLSREVQWVCVHRVEVLQSSALFQETFAYAFDRCPYIGLLHSGGLYKVNGISVLIIVTFNGHTSANVQEWIKNKRVFYLRHNSSVVLAQHEIRRRFPGHQIKSYRYRFYMCIFC